MPVGLDHSGLTPKALARVIDLCVRLPFREAREALVVQGIELSLSRCKHLTQSYGEQFEAKSVAKLHALAEAPLAATRAPCIRAKRE